MPASLPLLWDSLFLLLSDVKYESEAYTKYIVSLTVLSDEV